MLPSQEVVQKVPVFGALVPPSGLETIPLPEQDDDELMLRTKLQEQAPVVIAAANSIST